MVPGPVCVEGDDDPEHGKGRGGDRRAPPSMWMDLNFI